MNFLHPGLLFGLFGALLPVVVHLLGRRRGRLVEFAAMDFLLASEKRLAARRRIRDLLLLLARAALIALVVLVLARPRLAGSRAPGTGMPISAVLVLDASASMSAIASGESAFDRAKTRLQRELDLLPSGSEVAVIQLARVPRQLTPGFVSIDEAGRALRSASPGTTAGKALPALSEAATLLKSAHREVASVWIASDFQQFAWEDTALSGIEWSGAKVALIDAAPEGFDTNLALTSASPAPAVAGGLVLEARRSGNSADSGPGESLAVLEVEGRPLNRALLRFESGVASRATLAIPETAPEGVETSVALDRGGSLALDDRRIVWLEKTAAVRVLLADGAPDSNLYRDEVFYLERALGADSGRFSTRLVDASQGRLGTLEDIDCVLLANVERLATGDLETLEKFVKEGGGLLITAGDRTAPDAMQSALGSMLPARPRSVLSARPGEPPIGIAGPPSPVHVIALPFDERLTIAGLEGTRLERWLALEPVRGSEVVLSLSNGMPLVVVGSHGKGRVAVFASSADRDWSSLPVRPAFVPLFSRVTLWLAGRLDRPRTHLYVPGDRVSIERDEFMSRPGTDPNAVPEFDAPDAKRLRPEVAVGGGLAIPAVEVLGQYRALVGGRREPALDFAVNLDPAESDLARADPGTLRKLLGEDVVASSDGGQVTGSETRIAMPLILLAALAFLVEAALGRRGRRHHPESVREDEA